MVSMLPSGCQFFLLKHSFLELTLLSSDTTTLSKSYLKLGYNIVRSFLQNTCFSSPKKLLQMVTMALKPFTKCNFKISFFGAAKCRSLVVKVLLVAGVDMY